MPKKPTFDPGRPLSWSAISSFEYDPEQWYRKYVRRQEEAPSAEMLFGKEVGERIAADPTYLPALQRRSIFEYELKTSFNNIPLIGYIDSYEPHSHLLEYKTGKKAWDKKRADSHGQIDMYLLMLFLIHKVRPEHIACSVHWLPTRETPDFKIEFTNPKDPIIKPFETARTMRDLLLFGERIMARYKQMQAYAKNHA